MIVLITPTGARPDQFRMCAKWMKQQTYEGDVHWIIIDDARPVTTGIVDDSFRENWTIEKIYPVPSWEFGMNTQARNMKVALERLSLFTKKEVKAVFIIEDDDYYMPTYLEWMMMHLENYTAIGETRTIYYNVVARKFADCGNRQHASLFQTAFTLDAIPYMMAAHKNKFIDAEFWKNVPNKLLIKEGKRSIGMKGMPGRGGIGAGHKGHNGYTLDIDLKWLTLNIGEDNAKEYARYYGDSRKPQYDILTKKRY